MSGVSVTSRALTDHSRSGHVSPDHIRPRLPCPTAPGPCLAFPGLARPDCAESCSAGICLDAPRLPCHVESSYTEFSRVLPYLAELGRVCLAVLRRVPLRSTSPLPGSVWPNYASSVLLCLARSGFTESSPALSSPTWPLPVKPSRVELHRTVPRLPCRISTRPIRPRPATPNPNPP
jgi:hypothetical protein